jgi:hypothetical protein
MKIDSAIIIIIITIIIIARREGVLPVIQKNYKFSHG